MEPQCFYCKANHHNVIIRRPDDTGDFCQRCFKTQPTLESQLALANRKLEVAMGALESISKQSITVYGPNENGKRVALGTLTGPAVVARAAITTVDGMKE